MRRTTFLTAVLALLTLPLFADICGVGFLDTAYVDGPHPLTVDSRFRSTAAMYNSEHVLSNDVARLPVFFDETVPVSGDPTPRRYFDASKTFFEFGDDIAEGTTWTVDCGDYLDGVGIQAHTARWRERPDGFARYKSLVDQFPHYFYPDFFPGAFEAVFVHLEVNSSCINISQVDSIAQQIKSYTPGVDVLVGLGIPGATAASHSGHPVDFHLPERGQWFDGTYVDAIGFFTHGQVDPLNYNPPATGGADWKHGDFMPIYQDMVGRMAQSGTDAYLAATISAEIIRKSPTEGPEAQWGPTQIRQMAGWLMWRSWFVAEPLIRDLFVFPYPEAPGTPAAYFGSAEANELRNRHGHYFDLGLDPNACPRYE